MRKLVGCTSPAQVLRSRQQLAGFDQHLPYVFITVISCCALWTLVQIKNVHQLSSIILPSAVAIFPLKAS